MILTITTDEDDYIKDCIGKRLRLGGDATEAQIKTWLENRLLDACNSQEKDDNPPTVTTITFS